MYTETITQRQALMNGVPPQTLSSARAFSSGVDVSKSRRVSFKLYVGAVVAGGSLSCWLQESSDNFNTDVPSNDAASAFANSGGVAVSQTGLTTANQIITFEVNQSQLTTGKTWVRLEVKETAGFAAYVCVLAEGDEGQEKPNNANNGTAVGTQNVVT